jgi:hypothetical protein
MQKQATVLNPFAGILSLFFLLAVCGAIADWQYVKKGGVRSGNRVRILVWTLAAVFLPIVIFYGYSLGATGATLESVGVSTGELTADFFELVFIAYEFLRWRVREKHPIIAGGPKYPRVGGWLLFFIIYVTIFKPVWDIYVNFSEWKLYKSGPNAVVSFALVQIIWPMRICILLFGIYAGVHLWRVQRRAVRIAKAYLLAVIFQQGLELALVKWPFLPQLTVLELLRFVAFKTVLPVGYALIWYFYFKRSERVAATYPAQ